MSDLWVQPTEAEYAASIRRMHERDAREERDAWAGLTHMLDLAAELAVRNRFERFGDGEGGAILQEWRTALERHLGYALIPEARPKAAPRKPISARNRVRIFARDGYRCVTCGESDPEQLSLDHIVPVSKGGDDDESNLRTLCTPCNSRKGTKDA